MSHSPTEDNRLTLTPVKSYVPKAQKASATNREMSILAFISSTNGMCPFLQSVDVHEEGVNVASYPTSIAHPKVAERFCLLQDTSREAKISALRILAAELSVAILFLHQHGIVHQNVKPANVMISQDGHAILGDFGASRMLPAPGGLPRCMSVNRLHVSSECNRDRLDFGSINLQPNDNLTLTPFYTAPEVLDRKPDAPLEYDERVDWWSLGLTLYEMVVGINSFSYYTSLPQEVQKIDPELYDLLGSLLTREVNERLCGVDVQRHPFFDPINDSWDDIKALKHPPCLCPPRISFFAPKISREAHIDDKLRRQSVLGESQNFGSVVILQSSTLYRPSSSNPSNPRNVFRDSDIRHTRSRSHIFPDADAEDDGIRGSVIILQTFSTKRTVGPSGPNHRRAYSGGHENSSPTLTLDSSVRVDGIPSELDMNRKCPHTLPVTRSIVTPPQKITDETQHFEQSFNDSGLEFPVGELATGWAFRKRDNIAESSSPKLQSQEIMSPFKPIQSSLPLNDSLWTFEENLTISMLRAGVPNQPGSSGCKARRRVSSVRRIATASVRFVNAIKKRLIPVSTVRNPRW